MTTLESFALTAPDASDAWLAPLTDASFVADLDAQLQDAHLLQLRELSASDVTPERLSALQRSIRIILAVYGRLARLLQSKKDERIKDIEALSQSVLHITRIGAVCELLATRNRSEAQLLLEGVQIHVPSFSSDVKRWFELCLKDLRETHASVGLNKRPQVVHLVQRLYETNLAINGFAVASSLVDSLLPSIDGDGLTSDTMLYTLTTCYECDLPVLQRALIKLDDKAQKKAALLIPDARRVLLQILGSLLDTAMKREKQAGTGGDSLLAIIHDISHCTEANGVDLGTYMSDLWHLYGYEAKLLNFFDDIKMDRDNVSYLEVVLEGLPRRRVLEEDVVVETKHTEPEDQSSPAAASIPGESQASASSSSSDLDALISQVKDLFPDFGDGYVALCLLSSQNQLETVINFLLESNPPPALLEVRQSLTRKDPEYAALERKVLGKEPVAASPAPPVKSEKVDPSRIWVGKKTQEKHYDPRVARKAPELVEKMKQIVDEYAAEDNFREAAMAAGGLSLETSLPSRVRVVDEYDDDYNDEFEDYEPFSVHDGGQTEDFDAIREQNRRMRVLEEEQAYWEGMRNQNRRLVDEEDEEEEEGKEEDSSPPAKPTGPPSRGQGGGPKQGAPKGRPNTNDGTSNASEQQLQRNRNRNTQNKAKVANHHRKDRALKKRG
ncbi:hypothetical protein Poli38472_013569 [Pythium oligandrum]|uniref:CUE domain-containing protein n=1 Tax=Pythium oligandrum TaxID=41045 RepID=A0A8K1CDY1_PYTOL|nr:hypothetical protein Poli38472_013569 [Pythium oligandrum]|eukprot:TMW61106.1 hypothetical protein Poli38472_013569 [Pythium oligandrum]